MIKLTLLGVGASFGVPLLTCFCPVCLSDNRFNKRRRSAALLEVNGKRLLIDAGPDIRLQLLEKNIASLDGLFITHWHFDHVAGIDELKIIGSKKNLPIYLSDASHASAKVRLNYLIKLTTHFTINVIDDFSSFELDNIEIKTIAYSQPNELSGDTKVLGLRIADIAYVTDIKDYDEEKLIPLLTGVNTLVVGAIRENDSCSHFTFDEAIAFARKIKAKKTYFIHLDHTVDYDETRKKLPDGFDLGYDGLEIFGHL